MTPRGRLFFTAAISLQGEKMNQWWSRVHKRPFSRKIFNDSVCAITWCDTWKSAFTVDDTTADSLWERKNVFSIWNSSENNVSASLGEHTLQLPSQAENLNEEIKYHSNENRTSYNRIVSIDPTYNSNKRPASMGKNFSFLKLTPTGWNDRKLLELAGSYCSGFFVLKQKSSSELIHNVGPGQYTITSGQTDLFTGSSTAKTCCPLPAGAGEARWWTEGLYTSVYIAILCLDISVQKFQVLGFPPVTFLFTCVLTLFFIGMCVYAGSTRIWRSEMNLYFKSIPCVCVPQLLRLRLHLLKCWH